MITILGGSFDPIHKGHLAIARKVVDTFKPTEFRFLPCGKHAFSKKIQASLEARLAMLTLALADETAQFCIDEQEIKNNSVSYTIDTLRHIRATLSPQESLAFISGQDAFSHLEKWKEWSHLLDYAHLIVVSRTADTRPHPLLEAYITAHTTKNLELLKSTPAGCIYFLEMTLIPFSSSELRRELAAGQFPTEGLSEKVVSYIKTHCLYKESSHA
jgi:nicotinate-nucleotide adenylyltransferase